MKQLELFDEPEYIVVDDDYSGPQGDVREDFIELTRGVPAARGARWRCPRCWWTFQAKKPCKHHMAGCVDEEPWLTLSEHGQRMSERLAIALFNASKDIPNRIGPDTPEQRRDDAGAEIALIEMLLWHPRLSPANALMLTQWDPVSAVNTFGEVPDIPIGPGIEVRHIKLSNHHLTYRKKDQLHADRFFVNILGQFPRYGFAGFLLPAAVQNLDRFRTDYGRAELATCWGFPKSMKNYRIEDLIEECN